VKIGAINQKKTNKRPCAPRVANSG